MIQEPARVQETTYEATAAQQRNKNRNVTNPGDQIYSCNCSCSLKRTVRTVPMKASPMSTTTTIPIVINTQPNPRIILIKVPTHNNSNNNKSSRTEQSPPRTRLIRIPFLPGSVPRASPVNLALPTASVPVSYLNPTLASRIVKQATQPTGIVNPSVECSSSRLYSQVNQVAKDQLIGPPKTTTTTKMVKQTVPVSSTPQTLASMAGIQLTGADMVTHRDMSGAMPTATVEEIDVPVFIDEYLQNIEATSSTSSSSRSEENTRKEFYTETDIFDFDFDINLIAEDHIEQKEMDQCNSEMNSINSDNSDNDLIAMNDLDLTQLWQGEEEALDMGSMCNGIDITSDREQELDLGNILTSSENPMLGNFSQGSMIYTSSQTKYFNELPQLADENSMEYYYGSSQASLGFSIGQLDVGSEAVCSSLAVQDAPSTYSIGIKRTASAAALVSNVETMPQKRSKLILNINKSLVNQPDAINTPNIIEDVLNLDEHNSATNISTHDQILEELRSTEENTTFSIIQDFSAPSTPYSAYSVSTSNSHAPTCQTGFAGFITAPESPASPASPAFSTASTSQFSTTTSNNGGSTKRSRGRPAKAHADGPDPELMSQMTEDEQKVYQDRIKNNEASRVSRRKTKQREEEEKKEEDELQAEFDSLNAELQRVLKKKNLCQDYLRRNYHSNSTYVKPEPEH